MARHEVFKFVGESGRTFTLTRFRTDTAITSTPVPDDYVLKCDSNVGKVVSVTMDEASLYGLMMAIQSEVNLPDAPA